MLPREGAFDRLIISRVGLADAHFAGKKEIMKMGIQLRPQSKNIGVPDTVVGSNSQKDRFAAPQVLKNLFNPGQEFQAPQELLFQTLRAGKAPSRILRRFGFVVRPKIFLFRKFTAFEALKPGPISPRQKFLAVRGPKEIRKGRVVRIPDQRIHHIKQNDPHCSRQVPGHLHSDQAPMAVLYNILLVCSWPVYLALGLVSTSVRRFQESRREGREKFRKLLADLSPGDDWVWLHGSSVGEMDQALALAREIRRRGRREKIFLSVFSLSVKKLESPDVDAMFRMPLDFPWAWGLIQARPPVFFATMTWDVFPNLLRALRRAKSRAYLCSAALAGDSHRLRFPMAALYRSVYAMFAGIGAVDERNRALFLRLLPDPLRVCVTGDTRFDTIFHKLETSSLPREDEMRLQTRGPLLILASTYHACDQALLPPLARLLAKHTEWKIWIFPHHIDEVRLSELEGNCSAAGLHPERYSTPGSETSQILIVDRLGLLAHAYRQCAFAYVGGGFHHRIHNTGEPAALGKPVVTGPRIETSPVALDLETAGGLARGRTPEEAAAFLGIWMADSAAREAAGEHGRDLLRGRRGAAGIFYETFLESKSDLPPTAPSRDNGPQR